MADEVLDTVVAASSLTLRTAFIIGGAIAVSIWLLDFILSPRLDPNEPPLIKPTIPLIGHIIGILRHQSSYHQLSRNKNPNVPVASLQMLWGKIYAVWDPELVQAALRSRGPSFEPLMLLYAKSMLGASDETVEKIKSQESKLLPTFFDAIHSSLTSSNVQRMNVQAWEVTTSILNEIETLEGPNMYLWVRDMITLATTRALFGKEDPFRKDPSYVKYVWDWETQLADIVSRPFPQLTVRKAYVARLKLQALISKYYEGEHYLDDPTVSAMTRARAVVLRDFGFANAEIGSVEAILPLVGATNSAPQAYWLLCYIFGRPDLAAELREELMPLVSREGAGAGAATLDIGRVEARCPLLTSCYKEAVRLRNHNVSPRVMVADTTISDARGRQYLLKKGTDVQIASAIGQRMEEVWGPDAAEFDPTRFLPAANANADAAGDREAKRAEKMKDRAFNPFGGGRHLCPGRAFAFAQIVSVTATLLVGYDLEATGLGFNHVAAGLPSLASPSVKPLKGGEGTGFRLTRKKGWEGVRWRYV